MPNLRFQVCHATSHDGGHPPSELNEHSPSSCGWVSAQLCAYPQELIVRVLPPGGAAALDAGGAPAAFQLQQLQILSHESKIAARIEIFVSDGGGAADREAAAEGVPAAAEEGAAGAAFSRMPWERLGFVGLDDNRGSNFQARELKTVHLERRGSFLRLLLHAPHANAHNRFNQASIVALNLLGAALPGPAGPHPETRREGPPEVAPHLSFDEATSARLRSLAAAKEAAVAREDYAMAKRIKGVQSEVEEVGGRLSAAGLRKERAVAQEDYDAAADAKEEMRALQAEVRDLVARAMQAKLVPDPVARSSGQGQRMENAEFLEGDQPGPADPTDPEPEEAPRRRAAAAGVTSLADLMQRQAASEDLQFDEIPIRTSGAPRSLAEMLVDPAGAALPDDPNELTSSLREAAADPGPMEAPLPASLSPAERAAAGPPMSAEDAEAAEEARAALREAAAMREAREAREAEERASRQRRRAAPRGRPAGPPDRRGPRWRRGRRQRQRPRRDSGASSGADRGASRGADSGADSGAEGRAEGGAEGGAEGSAEGGGPPTPHDPDISDVRQDPAPQSAAAAAPEAAPKDPGSARGLACLAGLPNVEDLPEPEEPRSSELDARAAVVHALGKGLTACHLSRTWALRDAASRKVAQLLATGELADARARSAGLGEFCAAACADKITQAFQSAADCYLACARGGMEARDAENAMVALVGRLGEGQQRVRDKAVEALAGSSACGGKWRASVSAHALRHPGGRMNGNRRWVCARLDLLRRLVDAHGCREPLSAAAALGFAAKTKAFAHSSSEVRDAAKALTVAVHGRGGAAEAVEVLDGLRPAQQEQYLKAFAAAEESGVVAEEESGGGGLGPCQFCGLRSGALDERGLDLHYWRDCPVLIACRECEQVIEIAGLDDHLLRECEARNAYEECGVTGRAVRAEDADEWRSSPLCVPLADAAVGRCPLCHADIFAAGGAGADAVDEAWRAHLMDECEENPRRQRR